MENFLCLATAMNQDDARCAYHFAVTKTNSYTGVMNSLLSLIAVCNVRCRRGLEKEIVCPPERPLSEFAPFHARWSIVLDAIQRLRFIVVDRVWRSRYDEHVCSELRSCQRTIC
jgi:hypothetical protein